MSIFEISVIVLLVIGLLLQVFVDMGRVGINPHALQGEFDKADRRRGLIVDEIIERMEKQEEKLHKKLAAMESDLKFVTRHIGQ